MPRPRSRSSYLEKASSRLALEPRGKSYRYKIDKALWLLYRRLKSSAGVWSAEATDGHGKPWVRKFATADDYEPSDGRTILGKWEAVEEAKKLARGDAGQPLTIRVAIERDYAGHIKTNGSSPGNVTRLLHHLPDDLANKPIGLATERDYARWVHSLLASGLARGTVRRTKVNLQAALELAVRLNPALAVYRNTWKTGLSGVSDVHNPRDVFLTVKEVGRLERLPTRLAVKGSATTSVRTTKPQRDRVSSRASSAAICRPITRTARRLLVPRSKKGRNGTRKTGEKMRGADHARARRSGFG